MIHGYVALAFLMHHAWMVALTRNIILKSSMMIPLLKKMVLSSIDARMMVEVTIHGKSIDKRLAVPYNHDLCVQYDAHINVEHCAQNKLIKYLHKYMHEGLDWATIVIEDNVQNAENEITAQYYES